MDPPPQPTQNKRRKQIIEKKRKEKTEAALSWYSSKQLFLRFSVIHRNAPALEPLFHKIKILQPVTLLKRRLQYNCFRKNFEKF